MADTPTTPVPVITQRTKVSLPISVIVSIAVPLFGAVAWATTVYTTVNETHSAVNEMKSEMKEWRGSIEQRLRSLEHRSEPLSDSSSCP